MREGSVTRLRELESKMTPGPWVVTDSRDDSVIELSGGIRLRCNSREVLEYVALARELASILEVRHAKREEIKPPPDMEKIIRG